MIFRFGAFELDTGVPELRRNGEVVAIEPQVFELLKLLIENSDRAVTKEEIFENVWDGRIVSDSALSSRVKAARQALGDSGKEQSFIQTYHGRGFRFVATVDASGQNDSSPGTDAPNASLPERPSVAVLPFSNLSGDPGEEYFSDGITEDVSSHLARNRWLLVIGGGSTAYLKGRDRDVRAVGNEFNVNYVVEGSVRKSENMVRIAVQLVRSDNGATVWTERFDRELTDMFKVQDEIARCIAATIEPELTAAEAQKARSKPPGDLNAWDCYQRGTALLYSFAIDNLERAQKRLEQSIELDPDFAVAQARLAYVYVQKFHYGPYEDRAKNLKCAEEIARKAISLDQREALGHFALGRAYALKGNWDDGIAKLHDTIALNPGHAQPYFALGQALLYSHRAQEALKYLETALSLSPRDPHVWTFHHILAIAHYKLENMSKALQSASDAIRQPNVTYWGYVTYTSLLGNTCQPEKAKAALSELLALRPDYSCTFAFKDFEYYDDVGFMANYINGLRKAGLIE